MNYYDVEDVGRKDISFWIVRGNTDLMDNSTCQSRRGRSFWEPHMSLMQVLTNTSRRLGLAEEVNSQQSVPRPIVQSPTLHPIIFMSSLHPVWLMHRHRNVILTPSLESLDGKRGVVLWFFLLLVVLLLFSPLLLYLTSFSRMTSLFLVLWSSFFLLHSLVTYTQPHAQPFTYAQPHAQPAQPYHTVYKGRIDSLVL